MPERPPVIDADGHIQDRATDVRAYLEAPWNRPCPTALTPGEQPWDRDIQDTLARYPGDTKDLSPAQQIELWLKIMDEYGMEEAVLFPTVTGSASKLREPEFAAAVCRAVNNHFAKDYNALSDRVHLLGALPMQQPEEAAKELRLGGDGARHAELRDHPHRAPLRPRRSLLRSRLRGGGTARSPARDPWDAERLAGVGRQRPQDVQRSPHLHVSGRCCSSLRA